MFEYRIERMLNFVNRGGGLPKILIWSACEKSDYALKTLKKAGIDIYGYIDRDYEKIKQYNGYKVYSRDIIKSDKFFVYVALESTYSDILYFLHENNYKEYEDFWYPCRKIRITGSYPYSDLYGNEYFGYGYNNISIFLYDSGQCWLGRNISFGENIAIDAGRNSSVNIRDNCKMANNIKFSSSVNSKISIGNSNSFEYSIGFTAIQNSQIIVGNGTSVIYSTLFIAVQNSQIVIGNDCMISCNVTIRAGNHHNLFDLQKQQSITGGKLNRITLADHVWIGQRAVIFSGADIGKGSVVGINSFVNEKFPNNSSIAGNPARIIKNNIAWRREHFPYFDKYEDFVEFDYRDSNTEEFDNE